MSTYTPQVGDRVRVRDWRDGYHLDVEHVGREFVLGTDSNGHESVFSLPSNYWVKVAPRPELPDLPERWAVIHDNPHTRHTSLPYYDSPQHARAAQDSCRSNRNDHPPDLAYVRYIPDPDSIVWADDLDGGE